jgi:hypothetical protein
VAGEGAPAPAACRSRFIFCLLLSGPAVALGWRGNDRDDLPGFLFFLKLVMAVWNFNCPVGKPFSSAVLRIISAELVEEICQFFSINVLKMMLFFR